MALLRLGGQGQYQRQVVTSASPQPVGIAPARVMREPEGQGSQIMKAAMAAGGDALRLVAQGYREAQTEKVDSQLLDVEREFAIWKDDWMKNNQGVNARDAARVFTAKHEELSARAMENLDPEKDEIFGPLLKKRLAGKSLYALKEGLDYSRRQSELYESSVWNGQLESFRRLAQEHPEDWDAISLEATNLLASWQARNPGLDPTAQALKLEDMAQENRMDTLIGQGRLDEAKAALDQSLVRNPGLHKGGTIAEDLCNPLNLKKVGANGRSRDNYQVFASDGDGFRGAWNQLKIYRHGKRNLQTPAEMIRVWAPPSDGNNYQGYLETVAKVSGLDLNQPVDIDNPEVAARLIKGMATREGPLGGKYSVEQITEMLKENGGRASRSERPVADPANPLTMGMAPLRKARYMKQIEGLERSRAAELAQSLRVPVDDYLAQCEAGIVGDMPFTPAQIAAGYGEQAPAMLERIERATSFALDASSLSHASIDENMAMLESRRPQAGDQAFAEKTRYYNMLARKVEQDAKERMSDPVAYASRAEPKVRQAMEELSRDFTPQNFQAYRLQLSAALSSRGLRHEDLPLFSREMSRQLADKISFSDNPAKALRDLEQVVGPSFPKAIQSIVPGMGMTARLLASGSSDEAAKAIMEARANPKFQEQANAQLFQTPADKQAFDTDLAEQLREISQTFTYAGNVEAAWNLRENVGIYARRLMLNGLDADEAIKRAASEVIGDRYTVAQSPSGASYRIPNSLTLNPEEVPDLARKWLASLDTENLNFIASKRLDLKGRKRAARNLLLQNASFVNNEDESGLYVFFGGQAARKQNGDFLQISWDDLHDLQKKQKEKK